MRRVLFASVITAGACLWGCKTITEELPTSSTTPGNPTVTVPLPVVVTPIEVPQPQSPTPAPAPAATPAPAAGEPAPPAPSNGGGPVSQSCAPAPAPGNERCPKEGGSDYVGVVESAYETLIAEHPNWFSNRGGSLAVNLSEDAWAWAVIGAIRRKGYCAGLYGEEVSVRTSKAFSENFDVITSSGVVRRGLGSYQSTCYPASTTAE